MQKSTKCTILFICLILCSHGIKAQQQISNVLPKSSVSITYQNDHPLSKLAVDSIYDNNEICQKRNEAVKLDTLFWNEHSQLNIDSVASLINISANELAKQVLEIKHSNFYNNEPFNMLGSYSEFDARVDTSDLKKLEHDQTKTQVTIYDQGYFSNSLLMAHTDKCNYVYKSPTKKNSYLDLYMLGLGGEYSNLYLALDLDFLRMFDREYSPDYGGDRRIWDSRKTEMRGGPDDFKYYKAFRKDSTDYVVLISRRSYNTKEEEGKNPHFKFVKLDPKDTINFRSRMKDATKTGVVTSYYLKEDTIHAPDNLDFKYLLVNLKTKSIEKSGYYTESGDPSRPFSGRSYETRYKMIGNHYYLDQMTKNEFHFNPNINQISLSGLNFKTDSIISDPSKIKKISKAKADPRKENYIEKLFQEGIKVRNNKHN